MITSDAYSMFQAITKIQNEMKPMPVKFGYAIAINGKRLKDVAEAFEAARTALIKNCAYLDDQGEPVVENQMYKLRDTDAFNQGIKSLQDAEIEVSLVQVTLEDMPSEIEPVLVQLFVPMIKEPA